MLELFLLLGAGTVALAVLAAGLKVLFWSFRLVLDLILLPIHIVAGVFSLGFGLLVLPFLLIGLCLGIAGMFVGIALLPLGFLALGIAACVWLVRALIRPARASR